MTTIERLLRDGHRRLGTPSSGFRWVTADGGRLRAPDAERAHALRLPPAWTDVRVSRSAGEKVQAIGRDKAGRWQYRYHPEFTRHRDAAKYRRLLRFAAALPRARQAIDRDLRRRGLPREKVLACAVRILMTCFMRAGSEVYMRENGSFGVATLRGRHVEVRGDLLRFDFPGKSGQRHVRELRDRRVATVVRALLRIPGRDLLKFEADDGWVDVRRRHINQYVREIMGGTFTAKDFRTWAGTLVCACELARGERAVVPGRASRKRRVAAAVKATAHVLGNTPAVCRSSYISPSVLEAYARGKVVERFFEAVDELARHRGDGLHPSERALVGLLAAGARVAQDAGASGRPAARRRAAPPRGAVARRAAALRSPGERRASCST
jgi:DNA topoisomerase-1